MSNPSPSPQLGSLVRLTPWHISELPPHSSLPSPAATTPRPNVAKFILAMLDEGASFLEPSSFSSTFTHSSNKAASPSTADVEVHKRSIPISDLSSISWSAGPINRNKPIAIEAENWFARRSVHDGVSSKDRKGSASWAEFVYGLRDEHSKHECDFTPTLYDAHHILNWNEQVHQLEAENGFEGRYSDLTMSIYEMCHAIPAPLQPRCFSVLVVTASTSPSSFIAVTVPVDLSSPRPLEASFYSSSRNLNEGVDDQQRKKPVFGVYTAVETVRILDKDISSPGRGGKKGQIEWTMATASDAKGNLPMFIQKVSMPGAVPKDVSYFMDWIPSVSKEEVEGQKVGTH